MSTNEKSNTCGNILADALEDWAAKIATQDEFDISKHDRENGECKPNTFRVGIASRVYT